MGWVCSVYVLLLPLHQGKASQNINWELAEAAVEKEHQLELLDQGVTTYNENAPPRPP
jgi:Flp pilus assembly CpaE family ATPase